MPLIRIFISTEVVKFVYSSGMENDMVLKKETDKILLFIFSAILLNFIFHFLYSLHNTKTQNNDVFILKKKLAK
jgi:hypothetical protein